METVIKLAFGVVTLYIVLLLLQMFGKNLIESHVTTTGFCHNYLVMFHKAKESDGEAILQRGLLPVEQGDFGRGVYVASRPDKINVSK